MSSEVAWRGRGESRYYPVAQLGLPDSLSHCRLMLPVGSAVVALFVVQAEVLALVDERLDFLDRLHEVCFDR